MLLDEENLGVVWVGGMPWGSWRWGGIGGALGGWKVAGKCLASVASVARAGARQAWGRVEKKGCLFDLYG